MLSPSTNQEPFSKFYLVTNFMHILESKLCVVTNASVLLKSCSLVRKVSGKLIPGTWWEVPGDPPLLQDPADPGFSSGGFGVTAEYETPY